MARITVTALLALFVCACESKNACGGDNPLPFEPGTLCGLCGSPSTWVCASKARPGDTVDWSNYVACDYQIYYPPGDTPRKRKSVYSEERAQLLRNGVKPGDPCAIAGAHGKCAEGHWECYSQGMEGMACRASYEPEAEICGGSDNDCDGEADEMLAPAEVQDPKLQIAICRPCDDADSANCLEQCGAEVATESGFAGECEQWCQSPASLMQCRAWWKRECDDNDGDGVWDIECGSNPLSAVYGDCDDRDSGRFPGNAEVCGDGVDNDCDGDTESGSCSGLCGSGVWECRGAGVPVCSTSQDGSEFLPEQSACSTCSEPVPNGTDPGTGSCVPQEGCDYPYDRMLSRISPEWAEVRWEFCPGAEFCCNSIDDNGNGAVDENCDVPATCPECDSCERRLTYSMFEEWCPGINLEADRDSLLADLRDRIGRCAEEIESDQVLLTILENLDESVCRRALFRHLYWIAAGLFSRESICTEEDLPGSAYLSGQWLNAVLQNPCENTGDRGRFTELLIEILTHTYRTTGMLSADIPAEGSACLYGDFDFNVCPVPEEREVCVAGADSYECETVANTPDVSGFACSEVAWNPGPWKWPTDRCGDWFPGSESDPPIAAEFCPYGCDFDTTQCRPCALGIWSYRPGCRVYLPDGSSSTGNCGADSCGNSCGECGYSSRCNNAGISISRCGPADLICEEWVWGAPGSDPSWIQDGESIAIPIPVHPETDRICLGELAHRIGDDAQWHVGHGIYVVALDGIAGPIDCTVASFPPCVWSNENWEGCGRSYFRSACNSVGRNWGYNDDGCYDVRAFGLDGLVTDGEIVVTLQSTQWRGSPCHFESFPWPGRWVCPDLSTFSVTHCRYE